MRGLVVESLQFWDQNHQAMVTTVAMANLEILISGSRSAAGQTANDGSI
ncbi:hypothetical protein A4U53_001075 (plasmid) [Rhizobium ruizarguesonis]|uniref:Uncharacterized protein n=1 Tax=Rhizobium ruizarguesonis TaxID=2081791 RepID=A0ACD5EFE3_9HYPH|nr:hypothetical protein [Rhizobium leguminosarum]